MSASPIQYIPLSTQAGTDIPEANILCLGNFDGVHLAHRTLLREAKRMQRELFPHAKCGVLCFDPPSSDFLFAQPPQHLCSREQKAERFCSEGMDFVLLADFLKLRELSPEEFISEILIKQCHCVGVVCGFNYRFGRGGKGTPQMMQALFNGPLFLQSEVTVDGRSVSSTVIRGLIAEGHIEEANRLLTLPYAFVSPVLHGKALGRRLGAPTINQRLPQWAQIPRLGVYVTECEIDGVCYTGVSNVGKRPTVECSEEIVCETFLLDFSGDLYEKTVRTSFLHFLRPEQRFEGQDELRKQIALDIAEAKQYRQ